MNELKPCPSRNHRYSVICWECDLWFGYDNDYGGMFDTKAEAIKAWNIREGEQQ